MTWALDGDGNGDERNCDWHRAIDKVVAMLTELCPLASVAVAAAVKDHVNDNAHVNGARLKATAGSAEK